MSTPTTDDDVLALKAELMALRIQHDAYVKSSTESHGEAYLELCNKYVRLERELTRTKDAQNTADKRFNDILAKLALQK